MLRWKIKDEELKKPTRIPIGDLDEEEVFFCEI